MEVSSFGRVRRNGYVYEVERNGTRFTVKKPDLIYSQCLTKSGYPEIAIMVNKKRKKFLVHHFVARAFVPGYKKGLSVNHIDGVKTRNIPENLEWVTLAINTQKQWQTELVDLRGDNHPSRKLHSGQVRVIRKMLNIGLTAGEIAVVAGVSSSLIYKIKDGERWNHLQDEAA